VEVEEEFPILKRNGAEGIGLYRTEVLFLSSGAFPSEEEQTAAYVRAVQETSPHSTTFRLFDLGGDKMMPMADREQNPFLGWRGIRILLDRTETLKSQIRAVLRASVHGTARILLPMVTAVNEIRQFRYLLEEVKTELSEQDFEFDSEIQIGVMIEVPAAALMIDDMAAEADFLSIGTNDLTQYVLAVDRGNDLVSHLYQELHPSILKLIESIIAAGERAGLEVTVCGEMAAHPRAVPVLLGLGLRHFSVSPAYLLEVKRIIRAISMTEAREIAAEALRLHEAEEVGELVDGWLRKHACDPNQLLESLEAANHAQGTRVRNTE
jgi:phosphotransferase system enzyme I (PtsI)